MVSRTAAALLAASFLAVQCLPTAAWAENQMGYRLLSVREAANLPRSGGAIGLDVGRAQQISDGGMMFELLRVKAVRRSSPGAQAGFNVGDQIIAADARVFPSVAAFAAYVGSVRPGNQISVDYIPAGGGPKDAQRTSVTVGQGAQPVPPATQQSSEGMSTGKKLAIGAAAAALFGCYELGCFSKSKAGASAGQRSPATGLQPQR